MGLVQEFVEIVAACYTVREKEEQSFDDSATNRRESGRYRLARTESLYEDGTVRQRGLLEWVAFIVSRGEMWT